MKTALQSGPRERDSASAEERFPAGVQKEDPIAGSGLKDKPHPGDSVPRPEVLLSRLERMLIESQRIAHLGTWEWSLETNVLYWSDETYRIFDLSPETFTPTIEGFAARIHPEDREWVTRAIADGVNRNAPYDVEHRILLPDGRERIIHQQGQNFHDSTGKTIRALGTTFDITDRKHAERRLKQSNETLEHTMAQLRRLSLKLAHAEQHERQRMAGVLHNHLQQLLVGARYNVAALSQGISDQHLQKIALVASTALDEAIEQSKSLAIDLSPPILREGGLGETLKWLGRRMLKTHGLAVRTTVESVSMDEDLSTILFHAVEELLLNVVKHAGVSSAGVDLATLANRQLRITVCDEGRGFDPSRVQANGDENSGFGLFAVKERVEAIGGAMAISSEPSRGCRVTLIVPLGKPVQSNEDAPVARAGFGSTAEPAPPNDHPDAHAAQKTRVLLVDDHTVVRQGLAQLLAQDPELEIVGEAADGEVAVRMTREIQPDVVLMDVNMPVMSGVEATRLIHAEFPGIVVIGLSMYEEAHRAEEMRKAGAAAYVSKGEAAEALVATIYSCCRMGAPP